jgi:hypothetical protein
MGALGALNLSCSRLWVKHSRRVQEEARVAYYRCTPGKKGGGQDREEESKCGPDAALATQEGSSHGAMTMNRVKMAVLSAVTGCSV